MECFNNLGEHGERLFLCVYTPPIFTYAQYITALGDEIHYMLEKSQILGNQVVSIIIQFLKVLSIWFLSLTRKRKIKSEKIKMRMGYNTGLNQVIPQKGFLLTTGP